MKIHFKNGAEIEVIKEVALAIKNQLPKGVPKFQTFTDQNDEFLFMVNIEEIVYIA